MMSDQMLQKNILNASCSSFFTSNMKIQGSFVHEFQRIFIRLLSLFVACVLTHTQRCYQAGLEREFPLP